MQYQIPIEPNVLNKFFINAGTSQHAQVPKTNPDNFLSPDLNVTSKFKWKYITDIDIDKAVSKLTNSRAEDYYGLSNFLIKNIYKHIKVPLRSLINNIIETGVFPDCMKVTVTIPIYKKGEKTNPSNYRPISLIPIFSKIVEIIMHEQLCHYFEKNGLLNSAQYGFRSKLSTIKAVEDIVSNIYEGFENKLLTSADLLDLSKAFDSISHKILIMKMRRYGVDDRSILLLQSYLSHRLQIVHIKDKISDPLEVGTGVPQGSILGPFLFIVYINDLPKQLACKVVLYADDTTLINTSNCKALLDTNRKEILGKCKDWFDANCLKINDNKSENIVFDLKVNSHLNHSVKLLGIKLDKKLNWEDHISSLCSRLARVNYLLLKLKTSINNKLLLSSYFAYFHSHLTYGIILWGNSTFTDRVFKWQKKAVRCICSLSPQDSCKEYFKKLKIMTVPSLFIFSCLMHIKEHFNKLTTRTNIHTHNTRNKHTIDIPYSRLTKIHRSHKYVSIELFNTLPASARTVPLEKFKVVLGKWIKDKAFYSLAEFKECSKADLQFV